MSNESASFPIAWLCAKTLLCLRMEGKKHIQNPSFSPFSLLSAPGLWQYVGWQPSLNWQWSSYNLVSSYSNVEDCAGTADYESTSWAVDMNVYGRTAYSLTTVWEAQQSTRVWWGQVLEGITPVSSLGVQTLLTSVQRIRNFGLFFPQCRLRFLNLY